MISASWVDAAKIALRQGVTGSSAGTAWLEKSREDASALR